MSLIASLLLCGAALPSFASLKNPRVAKVQDAIRTKDAAAVSAFQRDFSTEADPDVRAWTLRAAAAVKTSSDTIRLAFFQGALSDASALVRMAAAQALGQLKGKEAASVLVSALGSEQNAGVRTAIADALDGLDDASGDAALAKALTADPDPNVRIRAAHALRRKGRRSALRAAAGDKDPIVRRLAQ